jgi:23S rRNA (cytosine1962-C5)-methyltransferase
MQINGFSDQKKYSYIHADVKQYLKTLDNNYFDIIVLDPPTFSNSQRMNDFFDIQRDHVEMINDCLQVLKEGGVIFFSTNSRKFVLDKERIAAGSIKDITKMTTPFDFEGRLFRQCCRIDKSG